MKTIVSLAMALLILGATAFLASANAPRTINFQGLLTNPNGAPVPDGTWPLTIKIYRDQQGGADLWHETQQVQTNQGVYNMILGSSPNNPLNLPFDQQYWIGVTVGQEPELPRIQLTAAPYAIHALVADALAGGGSSITGNGDAPYFPVFDGVNSLTNSVLQQDPNYGLLLNLPSDPSYSGGPRIYLQGLTAGAWATIEEKDNAWDGRSALEGDRYRTVPNDGSGYGFGQTNNAIVGQNHDADAYTFGVAGYSDLASGARRTGGVLGSSLDGSVWASLGYINPYGENYGVYTENALYCGQFRLGRSTTSNWVLTSDGNGYGHWAPPPSGSIGGGGTGGCVARFTGSGPSTTIGNSVLLENNGAVGIGATDAGIQFDVYCTAYKASAIRGENGALDGQGVGGDFRGGGVGAQGKCYGTSNLNYYGSYGAAYGTSAAGTYVGVRGDATGPGTNYGVWGHASGGARNRAAYFDGPVEVTDWLYKPAGSFKIDHPLDPANKYLYHSFVESPDMMNIYDGNVTLDERGEALVTMPEWFQALNKEFRYQLTCLGGFAPVYVAEEMTGNQFRIAGGRPGLKVSWQVTGIRHDPFADQHRMVVEEDKPAGERGKYLHPDLYGMPASMRIGWLEPPAEGK